MLYERPHMDIDKTIGIETTWYSSKDAICCGESILETVACKKKKKSAIYSSSHVSFRREDLLGIHGEVRMSLSVMLYCGHQNMDTITLVTHSKHTFSTYERKRDANLKTYQVWWITMKTLESWGYVKLTYSDEYYYYNGNCSWYLGVGGDKANFSMKLYYQEKRQEWLKRSYMDWEIFDCNKKTKQQKMCWPGVSESWENKRIKE